QTFLQGRTEAPPRDSTRRSCLRRRGCPRPGDHAHRRTGQRLLFCRARESRPRPKRSKPGRNGVAGHRRTHRSTSTTSTELSTKQYPAHSTNRGLWMSPFDWHYSSTDLIRAFESVGIGKGDIVFCHVSLENLGQPKDAATPEESSEMLISALWSVVGKEGTIVVPAYTFSFCRQEMFEVDETPAAEGPWSESTHFLEYFRRLPGAVRSLDPIHSVSAIGPEAQRLLANLPNTCFGEDSVFARLDKAGAKICTIGVGLEEATFLHYVEETIGVPFRFKKLFTGFIRKDGESRKSGWIYNVRVQADNGCSDGRRLEQRAIAEESCRVISIGRGEIKAINCREYFELAAREIEKDPWSTARGPAADLIEIESARVNGPRFDVRLSSNASYSEMIEALWHLPRDI